TKPLTYMTKSILKFSLLGLMAIAVAGTPVMLRAQDAPAAAAPKKVRPLPFHGKVETIDATAKTLTIGKETIQITSDTKIMKAGKPAPTGDGGLGDDVAGAYRKEADG